MYPFSRWMCGCFRYRARTNNAAVNIVVTSSGEQMHARALHACLGAGLLSHDVAAAQL